MFERLFQGKQLQRTRSILELFQAPSYTTTERDALKNPKAGMVIYNSTTSKINFYNGSAWAAITSA